MNETVKNSDNIFLFNSKKKLILFNIAIMILFNALVSTIIFNLQDSAELKEWFMMFALFCVVLTPFMLIVSFIFTMFWSLISLFNKSDLSIKKMYSVVLSSTLILFIFQILNFLLILNFRDVIPNAFFTIFSLIGVALVCLIMHFGFTKTVGLSSKFSKILLTMTFIIALAANVFQLVKGIEL